MESHVYSYSHGFRGFAAKLTEEQASAIASKFCPLICIGLMYRQDMIFKIEK